MKVLRLGLPKGSLQDSTVRLLGKAGFNVSIAKRSYFPTVDDLELKLVLLRAQEMSRYVESGVLDCGITGNDWILENASDVMRVTDLRYAKQQFTPVRWVIAVLEGSAIKGIQDLQGKRIATELVNVTKQYLKDRSITADVEFSWGATEVKVCAELVDAIVELTETGSSLRAHNLRIVETVCESTTQFITNAQAWKDAWKREKIENIALLLKGAIVAEGKVGLKMNVPEKALEALVSVLPAMKKPTVSKLSEPGWYALETVVEENVVRTLLPELKKAGAEAIVEYPLNKVVG
jgi:ATP phosphoribosyltransferase